MSRSLNAICLAIIASFWMSVMLCIIRYISDDYNAIVIVFWRSVCAVLIMLPWLIRGGREVIKTERIKLHFIRSLIGIVAMVSWFYALGILELPHATALSFTYPIFSAIAAVIFLKEKIGLQRAIAIAVGFLGVLVIIRPNFAAMNYGSFIVLFSTFFWAIAIIIVKKLSVTEAPKTMIFYMSFFMAILSLPLLAVFWQNITLEALFWFFVIGVCSNISHIALTKAVARVDLTMILPFDFLRLVFVGIFAYVLFGDYTHIYDILGSLIIISSGVFIAYREQKFKRS